MTAKSKAKPPRPKPRAPKPPAPKPPAPAPPSAQGPKTEGQRQLLEATGSEAELAARVGCGAAVVGHWRRGRRVPGEAHRHKLELLFGIPRRAWDAAPGAPLPASSPPTPPVAPEAASEEAGTLEITKTQIDAILAELKGEDLTEGASAKLRDTLAKLLALRSRLERDRDLLEDRLVREHPEWARTKARILDALRPYPEAAKAVAEALR